MQLHENLNHSYDLEVAIVGTCLIEPQVAVKVAYLCHPDWFYHDLTRMYFEAIVEMVSDFKKVDMLTVTEFLIKKNNSRKWRNEDSISYLTSQMIIYVGTGGHIEEWCLILESMKKARNLDEITNISVSDLTTVEKQDKIREILTMNEQTKRNASWIRLGTVLEDYLDHYKENYSKGYSGIKTGLKRLDDIINGLNMGELVLLAARPSIGKSALGQQLAVNAALQGYNVAVVTLEMTNKNLVARMFAYHTRTPFDLISKMKISPDMMDKLGNEFLALKEKIVFSEQTKASIEGIRAAFIKLNGQKKIDLLVIDYLQLMNSETKSGTRDIELGKISGGLKEIATQQECAILALAQLGRDSEKVKRKPIVTDLRESGNLEQDADVIIFIHGDRDLPDREIIVAKQRNGKLGSVEATYNGMYMEFTEKEFQEYVTPEIKPQPEYKPF